MWTEISKTYKDRVNRNIQRTNKNVTQSISLSTGLHYVVLISVLEIKSLASYAWIQSIWV